MKKIEKSILGLVLISAVLLSLNSCSFGVPKGGEAIKNFDSEKYLGQWYEIARFDSRFEKDLNQVTATYSSLENGNIKVVNRGYNYKKLEWSESEGEAKFLKDKNIAELKVSFFKPFWGSYNVIDIDEDYKYALVVGSDTDNMWILSREKTIPESYKQRFLAKANSLGFKIENLVWVE